MSTVEPDLDVPGAARPAAGAQAPGTEVTTARLARVGDLDVRRLLPLRQRRSVGAWCFVDHYGPASVDGVAGMQVPPHPHIGLQTVTWLIAGTVLHRDSLGSEQLIRPGQLNLMTGGTRHRPLGGIAGRTTTRGCTGSSSGWPCPARSARWRPDFEHLTDLPALRAGGLDVTVFAGSLADVSRPARVFSAAGGRGDQRPGRRPRHRAADPAHEHVLFAAFGTAAADGTEPAARQPALPAHRARIRGDRRAGGTRLFLLGGEPLGETLLMWWNFVGRTPDDIAAAARDWASGQRFGTVTGYHGAPLAAPPLDPVRLARKAR